MRALRSTSPEAGPRQRGGGDIGEAAVEAAVEVERLSVRLGGRELVTDVSFSARARECVALVGESGSGKTLTCRALLGSLHRIGATMTGAVRILGRDMSAASQKEWQAVRGTTIGFVPQASMAGLDPVMRIGKQLSETIRLHDREADHRGRALELLEHVEIADPASAYRSFPHQLSGGMRQRVMIALALAGRPSILVADEPTTALDVTVERAILDLLARLCVDQDMALLLVSHDLAVVRSIADQINVMYAGTQMERGATKDVLTAARHPYTRALLAADPAAAPAGTRLSGIAGGVADPSTWDVTCRFAGRCPHVTESCRTAGQELVQIGTGAAVRCTRWEELA
ncbi:ABC transporter ATP-binding protein [Streptosporangium sp. NPDC051022]|uniref:ABC transporter ATP-binding protein n=1 Tax=Streptosporangium sp. NPDC051022 TaxID=3155752 RepID=UPI003447F1DE